MLAHNKEKPRLFCGVFTALVRLLGRLLLFSSSTSSAQDKIQCINIHISKHSPSMHLNGILHPIQEPPFVEEGHCPPSALTYTRLVFSMEAHRPLSLYVATNSLSRNYHCLFTHSSRETSLHNNADIGTTMHHPVCSCEANLDVENLRKPLLVQSGDLHTPSISTVMADGTSDKTSLRVGRAPIQSMSNDDR